MQRARPGRAQGLAGSYRRRADARGFTLPELLIAITIFLTVAGGIALLFTQSVRTVKVGYQNIDVSENIRSTMDLIETDLTQAFASRDYGDYYTFYGSPIGMTFVGLVRPNRDSGQPNLSRVTWVLYGNPQRFTSYEEYAGSMPDSAPFTYSLVRYIEPDQDNLESFPIAWPDLDNPPSTENPRIYNLYEELKQAEECLSGWDPYSGCVTPNEYNLCASGDQACLEEVIKSKKRELWIRMLAGDPTLPPFWREDVHPNDPDNPTYPEPSIRDYVVAEDVVLVQNLPNYVDMTKENVERLPDAGGAQPYWAQNPASSMSFLNINPNARSMNWPMRAQYNPAEISDVRNTAASNLMYDQGLLSVDAPFRPLFVYGACCSNGGIVYSPFWNDYRNIVGVRTGDDPDYWIAEGNSTYAFGSPLAPRVPMMIDVKLQFLQQSPYAGAPDLFRAFTKQIDVPSGYARSDLTAG